jgi:hypothetical protein
VIVKMAVAEILDIFCEVTEEEDVLFANLAGNLNLRQLLVFGSRETQNISFLHWHHRRFR